MSIQKYLNTKPNYCKKDFLFSSQKKTQTGENKQINLRSYGEVLRKVASDLKLEINLGNNSLQKTWEYNQNKLLEKIRMVS